jgi:C4-dicarboxylate transporter, DctM subunit
MERISIAVLPFLAVEVAVLLLLTYLPELTLWLPRAFHRGRCISILFRVPS